MGGASGHDSVSRGLLWPQGEIGLSGRLAGLAEQNEARFTCHVASVTDGDTFRCSDGTRIRLHAVAARETDETCSQGHPCPEASAASATAELSKLVDGKTLACLQIGSSYNRVTAICDDQAGLEINCAMVRSGKAVIWPKFNSQRAICV